MTFPINIDDLQEKTSGISQNSFIITENEPEQATTKATLRKVRSLDVSIYNNLPLPIQLTDKMFVQKPNKVKNSTLVTNVTFPSKTRIWVYADTYPSGWKIVTGIGDRLLAVKGGSKYTTGGTSTSLNDWLNAGVNGDNSSLTIEQIPSHSHRSVKTKSKLGFLDPLLPLLDIPPLKGKYIEDDKVPEYNYKDSEPTGGSQTHNHGDKWRPYANVGIIIEKL